MPSRRGAQLKYRDNFTFYLYLIYTHKISGPYIKWCCCISVLRSSHYCRVIICDGKLKNAKGGWPLVAVFILSFVKIFQLVQKYIKWEDADMMP
jgi:hypothetical protein